MVVWCLLALALAGAQAMNVAVETEKSHAHKHSKHHHRQSQEVETERAQQLSNPAFQDAETRKLYHTNDQLFEAFGQLSKKCTGADMTFTSTPEPTWHYALEALDDGENPEHDIAVKDRRLPHATFNKKGGGSSNKKVVLLNFQFHGRELVAAETALRMAQILCGEKQRPSTRSTASDVLADLEVDDLLDGVELHIIPVGSPTARERAQEIECQRTNIRGEDLNRNWPIGWEAGDTTKGSDTWRGQAPLSSYESAALADLSEKLKPDLYMDVHSGATAMSTPFAKDHNDPPNLEKWTSVLNDIKKKNCLSANVGTHAKAIYTAQGTSLDYMYTQGRSGPYAPKKEGVPHAFLWEIYAGEDTVPNCQEGSADADLEANNANLNLLQEEEEEEERERRFCFASFNPKTQDGYERVVGHWSSAILDLVSELRGGGRLSH